MNPLCRALAGAAVITVALALGGCAKTAVETGVQDTDSTRTVETTGESEGRSPSSLGFREVHVKLESGVTITCLTALWGDVPLLDCDWSNLASR